MDNATSPRSGNVGPKLQFWDLKDTPELLVMPFPRASQALSRFTVLDLTRVRSGPTCVRQLADWGANVIKIETPPHLEKGEGPGGPRSNAGFPEPASQQAQHHA